MPPEHAREFGGGASESALNPISLVLLILASILILALPRKYVIVPLLAVTFLIPLSQVIVIAGSHFFVLRIAILAGLAKMSMAVTQSGESLLAGGYNSIDRVFLWCTLCQAFCVMLLFGPSAFANQVGVLLDLLGAYFVLRHVLQSAEELDRALKCLAIVSCILAACMIVEQVKLVNLFSLIGGDIATPHIREGKIRSQSVFQHELTAGAFGATLVPLFLLLWKRGAKLSAVLGVAGATVIAITSNSSTSLSTYAGALLAVCFWPLRDNMQTVRRGIVLGILALAAVMKAPVWFLLAHIDLAGGSSGYQRALLIDQFVRHFTDWFLIGVRETGSWGWDMWDAQNQFVNIGETGGLVAFCLFLCVIVRSFRRLGLMRKSVANDRAEQWRIWLVGAALFTHVVAFFGVNYFDQVRVAWCFLLATVSLISNTQGDRKMKEFSVNDANTFALVAAEGREEWFTVPERQPLSPVDSFTSNR